MKRKTKISLPGPKGPPRLRDLQRLRDQPHEFLRELVADYGPVVTYGRGPFRFVLLTDPDDVRRVLVDRSSAFDKATFQYRLLRSITGDGLLTLDGPEWLERRRLAQPGFHRNRIAEFVPLMAAKVSSMGGRWEALAGSGTQVDVAAEMMHLALQVVGQALFGVEIGDTADEVAKATLDVLDHIMWNARRLRTKVRWSPTRRHRRFRRSLAVLEGSVETTLAQRAMDGVDREDLLHWLMAEADGEGLRLTDEALRDEMITMIVAGHETVASALAWTWQLLAAHPAVADEVAREASRVLEGGPPSAEDLRRLPLTGRVFREVLRLYPPAWILSRRATEDVETTAGWVPAGTLVVLSPYVTHRDPDIWAEPDRFDPDRFLPERAEGRDRFAYFPFGGGAHLCIGSHFALVEAAIAIAMLGGRFRFGSAPDRPVTVEAGVTLHPKEGLWMEIERRGTAGDQ